MTHTMNTNTHISKSEQTDRKKADKLLRNTVKRISDIVYQVKSITRNETYSIIKTLRLYLFKS